MKITENNPTQSEKHPLTHRDKYPCKDCENRTPGCHDKCLKYYAYKLAAEKRKATEAKNRMYESNCNAIELRRTGKKPRQL